MAEQIETISDITPVCSNINPTEFDVTTSALLIGVGAEKYIDIFRKHNIGQCTLLELRDEDLIKLGINDAEIRHKILVAVQNLPIFEESNQQISKRDQNLGALEIADILEETSQHLYRIYLSMLANTLAIKKTKNITDCLVHRDKYASDIALTTISEITNILNSMDITLHTEMKGLTQESKKRNKKILIGTLGSAVIALLAVLFARSLKQLK
ncbi:uncharacterized protein LOC126367598 [Pectinophora gossypiella]|uniref:SAM domain-containing protein n=1 Tax=Pectinophora gossypiella TaxID=13191 RepID=A0A1E1VZE5_PECGO|nr:uncharacterized protein LOC126367598 [Pectinophora gossypiella]